jgi:replicative DNA helicase Mcm
MIDTDISDGEVRPALLDRFEEFLERYYRDQLAEAVKAQSSSVTVDHEDLTRYDADLADDLVDAPEIVLGHLEESLSGWPVDALQTELHADVTARVENITQTVDVPELRSEHKGKYLGVRGQVNRATQVQPKVTSVTFKCERCSSPRSEYLVGPEPQTGDEIQPPLKCPGCERQGPFTIHDEETINHQIIELAAEPGKDLGASQHTVPAHLYGDICGEPRTGDRIQVNGYIGTEKETIKGGSVSTRRPWRIEARSIDPEQVAFEEVTPERKDDIKRLANRDDTIEILRDSIASDLVTAERGDQAKLAVLLLMAGGVERNGRGDISIFLVGDKGTGKSNLLARADELAPKSVKVSGKGATAAGLTATATQSDYGDGWMLDAGALVLADGGIACIDEFDKMNDSARKSMHEAMEDQEVPINKAGINTVLQTKTAVLAAANPSTGVIDRYEDLTSQVNLEAPLLSRFDLIFVMLDSVDEDWDRQIAHQQHADTPSEQPVSDELVREYIAYARNNCHPTYENADVEQQLVDYYAEKRQQWMDEETGTSAFGPRMNDALRRLSQASARLRLSDAVEEQDAERAIQLMNRYIGDLALDPEGSPDPKKPMHNNEGLKAKVHGALESDNWLFADTIARKAGVSEEKATELLEKLRSEANPPKAECKNGKWRQA